MNWRKILVYALAAMTFLYGNTASAGPRSLEDGAKMSRELQKIASAGNWKDLREAAQKELDSMSPDDDWAGVVWKNFCLGLFQSNENEQYDDAFEKYAAGKFAQNIAFFAYLPNWERIPGNGIIINNKFKRGSNRGNAGRNATSYERDRAQLLALMAPLIPEAEKNLEKVHNRHFFCVLAKILLQNRNSGSSYKLQSLTNLDKLPDYDTDEGNITSFSQPPVNPDGSPVFYKIPESWDKAANDGERFRFAVERANCDDARRLLANFLCEQFDFLFVSYSLRREYYQSPNTKQYLYELKDNESFAYLASGIRKITLPDELNYIELYRKLNDYWMLGKIYSARLQFEKAADAFLKTNSATGKQMAEQIRGSWGTPDEICTVPTGLGFSIPYHFRNAKKLTVKLYRIDMEKNIDQWLEQLKNPENSPAAPEAIAIYRNDKGDSHKCLKNLIGKEPEKILTFDLHPLPYHWETTEHLEFTKMKPGAFIAEFIPDDNQDSRADAMLWITPYALTAQNGANNSKLRLFLNDPLSGKPVPGITLKIHSYYFSYAKTLGVERSKITPEILTYKTDENGIVEFSENDFKQPPRSYVAKRIVLAETSDKKLTLLQYHFYSYNANWNPNEVWRTFMITDKTVYKPGDSIAFSGYLRQPTYSDKYATFHNKTITLKFRDPQYKEAFKKEVPFDEKTQSFTFEMKLPEDAMLGTWYVNVENVPGYTTFTVEEYKKPEYLLTVTPPRKPVKAGEKIAVNIEAKYYFGAPLKNTEIRYKVFREETHRLIPFHFEWNWLYGNNYAFCITSFTDTKETNLNFGKILILNGKEKTDERGILTLHIDSSEPISKFGNKNFRYTVEAEVNDSSNRIVSGSGSIIAAVKPFSVSVYIPRGFAATGTRQQVYVSARTPDGEPVKGTGTLRIFRRTLNKNGIPERISTALKTIPFIAGNGDKPEFILNKEGVYELEAEIVSENGVKISESIPFFVTGKEQNTTLFSEYPISIATDKAVYQPGDTAQILVSCDKPGRTVYLITRSERDAEIQCFTLEGYSKIFNIPVRKDDQPNFFVNVMSYQNGKMLTLMKQIAVPPEKKILNVSAKPAVEKIKPASALPLKITVRGLDGKPVSGSVTITVYDKSLEAVHASPIPAVQPFFWKWLRGNGLNFGNNFMTRLLIWNNSPGMTRNIELSSMPFSYSFYRNEPVLCEFSGIAACAATDGAELKVFAPSGGKMKAARSSNAPIAKKPLMATGGHIADMETPGKSANVVRTNFQDRAFWAGRIDLPDSGETTVNIPVPDNLTTWVIRVWSLTPDTRVGEARTEIIVSKNLIARLELPRFMIQGDVVNAIVTINNTSSTPLGNVETSLSAPGLINHIHTEKLSLKANDSASYSVPLSANNVGEYTLSLSANSNNEADAIQLKLPVLVKGINKQINFCGKLDKNQTSASLILDIPEKRRQESTAFTLCLSPGIAKNMIELLPYLAADDSGDVFGIVNRFLPALTAKNALQKLNINWNDAFSEKTARDPLYSEYMQRYSWNGKAIPSFKAEDINRVAAESLRMICKMINSDGGWGWFGAYHEYSYPDTTAYVVEALLELPEKTDRKILSRGIAWLESYAQMRVETIKKDNSASNTDCLVARVLTKAGKSNQELMNLCYQHRVKCLAPFGYAMLALAYDKNTDEAKTLMHNLEQFLKIDNENNTAYLNIPSSCRFFWYGNENETLSAYLELLLRDNPQNPIARKIADYLTTNVRNSPWRNSVRSLGAAVRAIANYTVASGEGKPDFTVTVHIGMEKYSYSFNTQNMWESNTPALFIPAEKLNSGKHTVKINFSGTGSLYWNAMLNYFSLEDNIPEAGLEMKIQRNYYRLVQNTDAHNLSAGINGSAVKQSTLKYRRIPLKDGDTVKPGDLLEVELISSAKNDYDYVVFQDSMPAGFEYDAPVSGWMWNWTAPMYAEYKERGVKFYLRNMARGKSNAFYRIRAQLPGTVTALPARGFGIYAPELKCNSSQNTMKTKE